MIANIVKVELLYLVVTVSASALRDLKRPHTRLQLARLEALERLGNVRHAPRSSHDADEVRRPPAKALRLYASLSPSKLVLNFFIYLV